MAWDCRAHCIPRYDVGRGLSLRAAQLGPRDRGPLFERCDGAPLDLFLYGDWCAWTSTRVDISPSPIGAWLAPSRSFENDSLVAFVNESPGTMAARARRGNVCLDRKWRPQFIDLLFRRGKPCFFAFDLLYADGKDWRRDSLV